MKGIYFRYAIVGYGAQRGKLCTRISDFKIEQFLPWKGEGSWGSVVHGHVIGPVKKK